MDSAFPKELATEILSDSDHSTKVAPTTLNVFLKQRPVPCQRISQKDRPTRLTLYKLKILLRNLFSRTILVNVATGRDIFSLSKGRKTQIFSDVHGY